MNDGATIRHSATPAINLIEMMGILWSRKWLILVVSFLVSAITAGLTLMVPNVYRADVILTPASDDESLMSQVGDLGGLASLAGISIPGGSRSDEYLAILKSREFIWFFVNKHDLRPVLFAESWDADQQQWEVDNPADEPSLWDAYRMLVDDVIRLETDRRTGLIRLSVDWTDPELAASWANTLVYELNEHLRGRAIKESEMSLEYLNSALQSSNVGEIRQTLYQLMTRAQRTAMLASTRQEFAFKVVDRAYPPDKKVRPLRAFIVLAMAFLSGVLMCLYVLVRTWKTNSHAATQRDRPAG